MKSELLSSSPLIIRQIEDELRINQEAAEHKASLREMKQHLAAVNESFTLSERVGLSSKAADDKHKQVRDLETSIEGQKRLIEKRIEQWKSNRANTERILEKHLSDSSVEYQTSKKIKVFYRDLRKSLADFQQFIREFLKALGQARVAMCAQYNNETKLFHVHAQDRFDEAAVFGNRIDDAIRRFNSLADGHADEIKLTFLGHISLPRLTVLDAKQSVYTIRKLEIGPAHLRIEQTIENLEKLCDEELPLLEEQILAADTEHDETTTRYVESYWEQLRQQIWRDMQLGISHAPGKGNTKLQLRRDEEKVGTPKEETVASAEETVE